MQPQSPVKKTAIAQKGNPNSTQNTLQIAEIRDGLVIMHNGTFRAVVMVKSINFDLMSIQEKEAVEFAYQSFLNSLYFDIQIYIHSTKIDITPYLQKLDKLRNEHDNMLLAVMMDDYINFVNDIAENTNLMDKKYYIVIPYNGDHELKEIEQKSKSIFSTIFGQKDTVVTLDSKKLENAKTELKNRIETVLSGLQACGVYGVPLNTQELIELYYDSYNPDTATRQKITQFDLLNAPIIEKGEGQATQPSLNRESNT